MEAITNNKVVRSHNTASKYKQKVTHKHSTIKSSIEKRNIEESKSNISSSLINSESIKLFEPKSRSGNSIINEAIIESKLSGVSKRIEQSIGNMENISLRQTEIRNNILRSDHNGIYFDTSDADFWDQENSYLSEHNYDETIDTETVRNLLDFGDDYRNFLESNSEVQSPRAFEFQKKKRTLSKGTIADSTVSESEDENDDLFLVIEDLKRDYEANNVIFKKSRNLGFINQEDDIKDKLLSKCEASLKFLKTLQSTTDRDRNTDMVQRKQDREIRFLLNKWRQLEKSLKKDEKQKILFLDLRENIQSIDNELKNIKKSIERTGNKKSMNIKEMNRFYKDIRIKLSRMKPRLFELNLSVHGLLGEVSEDDVEIKHLETDRMKEDLVEVYEAWDEVSLLVSERLARLEDTGTKMRMMETGLEEVSRFLTKETGSIMKRMTATDSGVSDGSDLRLDTEKRIQEQEENIRNMKETITVITKSQPSSSFKMSSIIKALSLSSNQLDQLKTITTAPKRTSVSNPTKIERGRHTTWSTYLKYWRRMTFLLLLTLIVTTVFTTPSCCEHSNSMYLLLPSITYSSGMRPI